MIFHCHIGMTDGDIIEALVTRKLIRLEKHFKIHHIINDNRKLPLISIMVPGTYATYLRREAGTERTGCLKHYITITLFFCQLICLTETITYHKTQVVGSSMPLGTLYQPGIAHGIFPPILLMAILIHLPECTCEETGAPILRTNQNEITLLVNATRSNPIPLGCFPGLSSTLQGISQLFVGSGHRIIYLRRCFIKQHEEVAPITIFHLSINMEIILSALIERISTIEITSHFLLFFFPSAYLLIGPFRNTLPHIRSHKVHCLKETMITFNAVFVNI